MLVVSGAQKNRYLPPSPVCKQWQEFFNPMTKSKLQIAIVITGLISTGLGIRTMLQIPTMILAPWFLVGLYLPIAFFIALLAGFLAKTLLKSGWHVLTFTSIAMTVICLAFYISEYKPTYKIIIPDNYTGEVKLLVTDGKSNDFNISKFGIGYINQQTYKNRFRPIIIKGQQDISKEIRNYSIGSYVTTSMSNVSFNYVSLEIPGKHETPEITSVDSLIALKAIDTTRLWKK